MKQLVVLPLVILLEISSLAQILSRRPAAPAQPKREMPVGAPPIMVPLDVPVGTPLKIVLDGEVRIHEVGQPIRGRVVEPVYAFQKLVIPEGTQA
ncbi:MAG: hypothetical protein JO356_15620, partial [Acidobacteria bacterium]|nr:hypothetical protein [Acidobacteriota bacterium]